MRICNYVGSHSKMARWTPSPEPIIRVGNLALRPNFIVVNLFGNRQVQRPLATPTSADHTYASPTTFSSSSRGESCDCGALAHCGAHRACRLSTTTGQLFAISKPAAAQPPSDSAASSATLAAQPPRKRSFSHHLGLQPNPSATLGLAPSPVTDQQHRSASDLALAPTKSEPRPWLRPPNGPPRQTAQTQGLYCLPCRVSPATDVAASTAFHRRVRFWGQHRLSPLPGPAWHGLKLRRGKYSASRPPQQQQPWQELRLQSPCPSWSPWPALAQPPCQQHHPGRLEASSSPPSSGSGETCSCHRF